MYCIPAGDLQFTRRILQEYCRYNAENLRWPAYTIIAPADTVQISRQMIERQPEKHGLLWSASVRDDARYSATPPSPQLAPTPKKI